MVMSSSAERSPRPPDPVVSSPAPPRRPEEAANSQHHLHNFSFPILTKWGGQRLLRCAGVNRNGDVIGRRGGPPIRAPPEDGELEEVRAKLMAHLREAADRMELPRVREEVARPLEPVDPGRPWNLRARRATRSPEQRTSPSPPPAASAVTERVRSARLRSEAAEKRERARFSVSLSKEEIEEDIYSLTGSRPRRRPRKRARAVQKQLDFLSPGAWLTEITAETYRVPE